MRFMTAANASRSAGNCRFTPELFSQGLPVQAMQVRVEKAGGDDLVNPVESRDVLRRFRPARAGHEPRYAQQDRASPRGFRICLSCMNCSREFRHPLRRGTLLSIHLFRATLTQVVIPHRAPHWLPSAAMERCGVAV